MFAFTNLESLFSGLLKQAVSLNSEMTQISRKSTLCKKAAAIVSQLGLKMKREKQKPFTEQQISSNVPHESIRVPDAEYLTANAEFGFNILKVYWSLSFLLRWSLQIPDLFN